MSMLQKAILPGRERSWAAGDDLLCGYVVRAEDVAWARTPAQLVEAHGLGFPGSPFSADSEVLDVLRLPVTPFLRTIDATGLPTGDAGAQIGGEGFVDHPPFTGNGFAAVREQQIVPVWWLNPMRVPAASELLRIHRDGTTELLAFYNNVASGWQPIGAGTFPPSDVMGVFGTWHGIRVFADVLPDGRIVIASPTQAPELHLTERGLWATTVDAAEVQNLHTLQLTATWRGLAFQMVRRWTTADGLVARLVYLGRDSRIAEAAGLEKMDAAVYEATAPVAELVDVRGLELVPR